MDQTNSTNKKALAIVGLLVIVAVIGVGVYTSANKSKPSASTTTPAPSVSSSASSSPTPTVASDATSAGAYKDGTYSAVGSYDSPGGHEAITVNVTLKDGTISDTSAVAGSTNPTGQSYQAQFIGGYKTAVVGKNIDQVTLSKVSGSSLTSQGFNDAISQIKAKAKA